MLGSLLSHPWIRALALVASVVTLIAMLWQRDEAREPTSAQNLRGPTEPDGFVVNGRYLSFNEAGQREMVIESPRIEQFESRRLATMISPSATLYDTNSGTPWDLTAQHGTFLEEEDIIELEGDVLITRPITEDRNATLESERLTLDNAGRTIYTDTPVVLTEAHGITRAVGMKAWVDDRTLELQSQVEGRYETAKPNNE